MIISCPGCGASFNIKPEALGPAGRMVKCSKCAHRWRAMPEGFVQDEQSAASDEQPGFESEASASEASAPMAAPPTRDSDPGELEGAPLAAQLSASGEEAAPTEPAAESDLPPGSSFRLRDMLGADAGDGNPATEPQAGSRGGRLVRPPLRRPRSSAARIISLFTLILLISGIASVAVFMQQNVMMWLPATQRLYAALGVDFEVLGEGLQITEPKPTKEVDGNDEILVVEGEVRNVTSGTMDVPLMRGALLDRQGQELHIWTFTAAKPRIAPGETARYRTEFRNPPKDADRLDITFTRSGGQIKSAQQADALEK